MLDVQTKRRIDNARDILVGKVPDPKSQVEQITLALIYKFMDDMDKQSEEWGGKASFFTGEFTKYSWSSIFDPKLGGYELLNLYSEALLKMNQNPNIPVLFRDIFKNAYLPYRDPETLKSFLKEINGFCYDHSERLGDAYEYLLSVLGSQGDAGQFRTPRHIIDFIVKVLDPKKNDTILDPACGTAGFLISSFKYIMKENTRETYGDQLTPEEKNRLITNFTGYDISPDMVRISMVNMYLHGFANPKIHEYDALTSEERWNDTADVILANPPFMTPKGGIRPHKRFSIQANRSEVLFVDYIAEHLNNNGRAGIIVPEGIIFQSGNAYKALRKMLIENYLYAVVSLPAGVFNPYSGVKTSILFLDKALARKTDSILFVKVENDGFDLGAQRREIEKSDLPVAYKIFESFKTSLLAGNEIIINEGAILSSVIKKEKIAKNGDYILNGDRHKLRIANLSSNYQIVELGTIADIISGQSPESKFYNSSGDGLPFYQGKTEFTDMYMGEPTVWTEKIIKLAEKGDILMSVRAPVGPVNFATQKICIGRGLTSIRAKESVLPIYLFYILRSMQDTISGNGGAVFDSISRKQIENIKIPLPPLEVQKEIISEIEGYQKIIDGAKQIIKNYTPQIKIAPDWEWKKLGEISEIVSGFGFDSKDFSSNGEIKSVKITNVGTGEFVETDTDFLPQNFVNKYSNFQVFENDIVIALTRPYISNGLKVSLVPSSYHGALLNQRVALLREIKGVSNIKFLYYYIRSEEVLNYIIEKSRSLNQPNLSIRDLYSLKVPNPSLEIQNKIAAIIEEENNIVKANNKLVDIFEQKIKDKIGKMWEK